MRRAVIEIIVIIRIFSTLHKQIYKSPDYPTGVSLSQLGSVPRMDAFPDADVYLARSGGSGNLVEDDAGFQLTAVL
jgi:hypothetical protein